MNKREYKLGSKETFSLDNYEKEDSNTNLKNIVCSENSAIHEENTKEVNEKKFKIEILIKQPIDAREYCGFLKEVEMDLIERSNQVVENSKETQKEEDEVNFYHDVSIRDINISELLKSGYARKDSEDQIDHFKNFTQQTDF
jgi:cytidine deaminase